MKLYSILLVVFLHFSVTGQITYTPVFVDQCTGKLMGDYITLTHTSGNKYETDYFEQTSFDLPEMGTYTIECFMDMQNPIEVEVRSDQQIDTFYSVSLEIPLIISNPPPTQYRLCNQIAEGYCEDFYQEGKLRRKGTFKNGHPIDTIKTYYYSGEIKELDIPLFKGEKRVDFYKNGNVQREYNSKKSLEREYYPSGQLSHFWQYRKHGRSIEKEYYENGQLKKSKKKNKESRFAPNGSETDILSRRITYGYFNFRYRSYEIRWKKCDAKGKLESEIIFERSSYDHPAYPKDISEVDSTDVKEVVLFEQGKPVKKISVEYRYIDSERVFTTTIFKKEDQKWVETQKGSLENLSEFL